MASCLVRSRKKIRELIDFILNRERIITVRIEGEPAPFASKIIKVDYGNPFFGAREQPSVMIKHLSPERGNALFEHVGKAKGLFSVENRSYEFDAERIGASGPPFFGHIIAFPESMRFKERRKIRRDSDEIPQLLRAEFRLKRAMDKGKVYELVVINYSANGAGLLVTGDEAMLIEKMKVGDKITDITLYTEWSSVQVDGTVIHITEMKERWQKKAYILGIRFDEPLEEV